MKVTSPVSTKKNRNSSVAGYAAALTLCVALLPAKSFAFDGHIDFHNCSGSGDYFKAYLYNGVDLSDETYVTEGKVEVGSSKDLHCNDPSGCTVKLKTNANEEKITNYDHKNMYVLTDSSGEVKDHGHESSICD